MRSRLVAPLTAALTVLALLAPAHADADGTGTTPQTITFNSPAGGPIGSFEQLAVSTDADGLPVFVSVDPLADGYGTDIEACSVTGTTVFYDHGGRCVLDADQPGDATYAQAARVQRAVTVDKLSQAITTFDSAPSGLVGDAVAVSATSTAPLPVTVSVDPASTGYGTAGQTCALTATSVDYNHAGHCVLDADQPGDADYAAAPQLQQAFDIGPADTTTELTVATTTLTATVSDTQTPAVPTGGAVTFLVDGVPVGPARPVLDGQAVLRHRIDPGASHTVSAGYGGSADFNPSTSAAAVRSDPVITVALSSHQPLSSFGWYRRTVAARFTCTATTARIAPCPATQLLSTDGRNLAVIGTVTAVDGGKATVRTSVDLDSTPPTVAVTGVQNGAVYVGQAPVPRCVGHDALSGVASCTLTLTSAANGVTGYRVSATDRAGNVTSASGSYRIERFYLPESTFDDSTDSYVVHTATPYTLVALAAYRGTYYLPVHSDEVPSVAGAKMQADGTLGGLPRWVLPVTFKDNLHLRRFWNLGVLVGTTMHVIRIQVL